MSLAKELLEFNVSGLAARSDPVERKAFEFRGLDIARISQQCCQVCNISCGRPVLFLCFLRILDVNLSVQTVIACAL